MAVLKKIANVVFISSSSGATYRYRVLHQAEQLRRQGITVQIFEAKKAFYCQSRADIYILHRVSFQPLVQRVITEARKQGAAVLMDVDDLVFDPSLAAKVGGYNLRTTEAQRQGFVRHLEGLQQSLLKGDGVIASTEKLAEECRRLNSRVIVNRNALSHALIHLSVIERQAPKRATRGCVLGYFSGTPTHDADFASIVNPLNTVMEKYSELSLMVVGYLSIPKEIKYKNRIKHLQPVNWEKLPGLISQVDVNLAPLELSNLFCHCKSELKYIEAGILGIPTVASAAAGMQEAVTDGVNGLLAATDEEWTEKLNMIIENYRLRRSLGERAYQHVRQEYNIEKRSFQFISSLAALISKITAERV
jgi:glycosyltransferase involved in cell wall biosynthesis